MSFELALQRGKLFVGDGARGRSNCCYSCEVWIHRTILARKALKPAMKPFIDYNTCFEMPMFLNSRALIVSDEGSDLDSKSDGMFESILGLIFWSQTLFRHGGLNDWNLCAAVRQLNGAADQLLAFVEWLSNFNFQFNDCYSRSVARKEVHAICCLLLSFLFIQFVFFFSPILFL